MPRHEQLNNKKHKSLRLDTKKRARYGDNVTGCLVFPGEFKDVAKELPIYFQKNGDANEYQAITLFGFEEQENLFLSDDDWQGRYVPALIRREPFLIGFNKASESNEPEIHIDMESPRITDGASGEPVFLESGNTAPVVDEVRAALTLVHSGMQQTKAMFEAYESLDLIEPFLLDITFDNGSQYKTDKYYTLNQDKLYSLDHKTVIELHKSGLLQMAYLILSSLSNVKYLIDKKNTLLNVGKSN
ncbi:SapC family protein [Teredinibacter franksiae]|uniref:SapC family protein n=1 Tax=Teredinibacter franksiae TaxID=2761453 RepID=UPI0016298947|nr:SapC family protein [Teredinibacter franksiae]